MAAPVCWGETVLAVLVASSDRLDAFLPADQQMLDLFSTQAALAMRNARILQEVERQRRRSESLLQATQTLTSTLELEELFGAILQAALRSVPAAQRGCILLLDETCGELCVRAAVGYNDAQALDWRCAPGSGYLWAPLCSLSAVLVQDARQEGIWDGPLPAFLAGALSAVAAPLRGREGLLGVLALESTRAAGAFNQDDLVLIESFASQAAFAIENASLYVRARSSEERLRLSLQEKEVLLREIHHRVKNNLQVVSSLLSLQSFQVEEPGMQALLRESQDRVKAMAMVHEMLYQTHDLAQVDIVAYSRSLVSYLVAAYQCYQVEFQVLASEPVHLPLDRAIPFGLLVQELLSNALKHAFPPGSRGRVDVEIGEQPGERVRLAVRDNGAGMRPGVDVSRPTTMGLQLVNSLARQLNSPVKLQQDEGTAFEFVFPRKYN
jgi:two-component sensor histidine kinase